MAERPPIQVRTYDQGNPAATGAAFEADAAEALRNGYSITSQVWNGPALTVTYQLQGPAAQPPKKKQSQAQQALGCGVLVVVGLGIIGLVNQKHDTTTTGGPPPAVVGGPAATPPPGDLSLSKVTVTSRVQDGDTIMIAFRATNDGAGPASLTMRVGGASGKAEFKGCGIGCEDQDEVLGTRYLRYPDLAPGASKAYTIFYRALEVGHIDWSISPKGDPDDLWTATTVVTP